MTSVNSNLNFLCGRPHGAGPPVHMRPPEPDPPPCGRHKWMAPYSTNLHEAEIVESMRILGVVLRQDLKMTNTLTTSLQPAPLQYMLSICVNQMDFRQQLCNRLHNVQPLHTSCMPHQLGGAVQKLEDGFGSSSWSGKWNADEFCTCRQIVHLI